jgi:copper transport protein
MRKLFIRILLSAFLAAVVGSSWVAPAFAHAKNVRSDPANNSVLPQAPDEVRLWYNEPISADFSTVELLDLNGQPVKLDGLHRDEADPTLLILDLPELAPGVYSVTWQVLSETDGHFTRGMIVFGIGEQANLSTASTNEIDTPVSSIEVVLRWLNFGLLAALTGAVGMAWLVLSPARLKNQPSTQAVKPLLARAQRNVFGWAGIASGISWIVGLALLFWQTANLVSTLPGGVSFLSVIQQVLFSSRWGALWLTRQFILILLFIVHLLLLRSSSASIPSRPGRIGLLQTLSVLLVIGLIAVQALSGHAAGLAPRTGLSLIADTLHLLAAGLWVGGLLAIAIGVLPLLRKTSASSTAPSTPDGLPAASFTSLVQSTWGMFGRYAALSVGILFATGLYNMGREVASLDALLTTLYGRVLIGKVGLVLAVGAFGFFNSMLLHPRVAAPLAKLLRRPSGWTPLSLRALPRTVIIEVTLGLSIFLVVGLLTSSAPARGPEFAPALESLPTSLSQTVDDLVISFSAQPNQPGDNLFTLRAISTRRPPPADILRVIVRFTFLGQDIGTSSVDAVETEPGVYQVGGSYLSISGPWKVEVAVRRKGLEDSVATFSWSVAPIGGGQPKLVSNYPWETLLTDSGIGLLFILLLIFILNVFRLPPMGRLLRARSQSIGKRSVVGRNQ